MKPHLKIINYAFILIFILSSVLTTAAAPFINNDAIYVDSSKGSGSNDGFSTATPKSTIQQAVDIAEPGDTIYVRGGTYYENIIITRSGSESAPITLTSLNDEQVVINGGSNIALRSKGTVNYWVVENLTIRSTNRYTIRLGWWGEPTTSHWTIRNNQIFGANFLMGSYHLWEHNNIDGTGYSQSYGDAGISDAGDSHNNIYRNNTVHDFTHYDARGIWTQGYTHDTVIENNYVYNIMARSGLGQCIDLDGAAKVEWGHVVRNNTVENCSYVGIQLENTFDSIVEKNTVIEGGNAGIIVIQYDSRVGCPTGGDNNEYGDSNGDNNCRGDDSDVVIRQNVITTQDGWSAGYGGIMNWYAGGLDIWGNTISSSHGTANGGINIQGTAQETKGTTVINNVIKPGNGVAVCAANLEAITAASNNLVYRDNDREPYASGTSCNNLMTLEQFQSTTGLGQSSLVADPKFVNSSAGDFSLAESSPAIDNGTNIGATSDIKNMAVPSGAGYDIGAYEFEGQPMVEPTEIPTEEPTPEPTEIPTKEPTTEPEPTAVPTEEPTTEPEPTAVVTEEPTEEPTKQPEPTSVPTEEPRTEETLTNVALGKKASQSSDYQGAVASRAVDGNNNGVFANNSVSSTAANTNAWWEVDLGKSYDLSKVILWNRTDCCNWRLSNFYILISDVPFESQDLQETLKQPGVTATFSEERAGKPSEYGFDTTGRYVRIQLLNRDYLALTEVEVFGTVATMQPNPTEVPTEAPTKEPEPTAVPTKEPTEEPKPTTIPTEEPVQEETVSNVALGKTASQSSDYKGAVASRAVDGNNNGIFANNAVSSTAPNTNAWWEVDLGKSYDISKVVLWNRTDCCDWRLSDFYILISDEPFLSQDLDITLKQPGVTAYFSKERAGKPSEYNFDTTGRYVRIQLLNRDYLALTEVEVFGKAVQTQPVPPKDQPDNIALGKTASQSSDYKGAVASRAVDGNNNGIFTNNSVSSTAANTNAWWEVDLGSSYDISKIILWNRTDCCDWRLSNFYILISDVPFESHDLQETLKQPGVSAYFSEERAGKPSEYLFETTGRYVRIQLLNRDYLALTEVEVFGTSSTK